MMRYNIKDIIYKASAILILICTILYSFKPHVAVWGMVLGVSAFSAITLTSPYPGKSLRGKRLYNFQLLACVLMIVSTFLMYRERNEWPLLLLVAAIFLFYSAFMLSKEWEKEKEDSVNIEERNKNE